MTINTDLGYGGQCTQTWSSTAAWNITMSPGGSAGLSEYIASVPTDRNMAPVWGPDPWNWHGFWWYQEAWLLMVSRAMHINRDTMGHECQNKIWLYWTNNPNMSRGCSPGLDVTLDPGGNEVTNISPFIPHHFHLVNSSSFHSTWTILFSFHSHFSTTYLLILIASMGGLVYISSPSLDYEDPGCPVGIFHIPWLSSRRKACAWVQLTWMVRVCSVVFFNYFK